MPRKNLPIDSVIILKTWLARNILHAYPTENEKRELAKQAALNLKQVDNWFINARRRLLPIALCKKQNQMGNLELLAEVADYVRRLEKKQFKKHAKRTTRTGQEKHSLFLQKKDKKPKTINDYL